MSVFIEIANLGVVPVIAIEDAALALPLADALLDAGLPIAEITLRTPAAVDVIEAIARHRPEMLVGAGTVLTDQQVDAVADAGARFALSPGIDATTLARASARNLPFAPGIASASELQVALRANCELRTGQIFSGDGGRRCGDVESHRWSVSAHRDWVQPHRWREPVQYGRLAFLQSGSRRRRVLDRWHQRHCRRELVENLEQRGRGGREGTGISRAIEVRKQVVKEMKRMDLNQPMMSRVKTGLGFIAALDQSGGSTPKALSAYGVDASEWDGDNEMYELIHAMRSRIVQSKEFNGDRSHPVRRHHEPGN